MTKIGGKVKYHQLTELEKKKYLGDFYRIMASLNGYEETKSFFKDLLTLSEAVMIARRIQIAKRLLAGQTYDEIKKDLKVGANNIAHVDRWLNNGFGGYKTVLKRFSNKEKVIEEKSMISPGSLDDIRRKYPAHFALLNLLLKNKK